ncbi:septal ring lytic transglycosylase RlpA family protein [Marinilabilia rubra]|uniref:Probable endolytic peptidoglycan transglycosylase RlpA n=1 Tax=Marinilabilia rubra TaxID=2162893 RepID=A0A2U2B5I7_9BACT|nr:septal ring lytic transglycosylase RlpA family protein [Marinilabilia rubra]PWD98339.1 septal ring lytic transglycosylase RlpA family lipoprotein [Marinilabilia rubra]
MKLSKRQLTIMLLLVMALVLFFQDGEPPYTETGAASYYASSLEGNLTSGGEIYKQDSLTAAHRTLPFGTFLKVENIENGNTVVVKVNDRGPYADDRILDLSRAAFKQIAPLSVGVIEVRIEEVDSPKP